MGKEGRAVREEEKEEEEEEKKEEKKEEMKEREEKEEREMWGGERKRQEGREACQPLTGRDIGSIVRALTVITLDM